MKLMGNLHLFGYWSQPLGFILLGNLILYFGQLYFFWATIVLWATICCYVRIFTIYSCTLGNFLLFNSSPFTTQPAKPSKKNILKIQT